MSTLHTSPSVRFTPAQVLNNAAALISALRERFAETESLRRLPEETVEDAHAAGIFTLLLPLELGGSAGGAGDLVRLLDALAQGDPSAAWTLGFLTTHNWFLARFPAAAQEEFFKDGRPAQVSGVANPPGQAVAVDGGYVVTGRWGYSSAVHHADWVMACTAPEDEPVRWFVLPCTDVEVQDT